MTHNAAIGLQLIEMGVGPRTVAAGLLHDTIEDTKVTTDNIKDELKKAIITIKTEKSWVSDNDIEKEDLALLKFNEETEEWVELTTIFKEEDDAYYYFDVELTSFSYFVISEKVVVAEEEEEKSGIGSILSDAFPDEVAESFKGKSLWAWVILIAIIIVVAYVIIIRRKQ